MVFLVCNLASFEITEWEPCTWLLNISILADNDSDTADNGKPRIFILCEKKHEENL